MSPPGTLAVDQQRSDTRRPSAGDVLIGRVPDVQRLVRPDARKLERRGEDRRVGLACTRAGRGDHTVEQAVDPASLQDTGQAAIPVRDGDQAHAAVAQAAQRRNGVRIGAEADRRNQLVDADLDPELS